MNYKMILNKIGNILKFEAVFLLLPLVLSLYNKDGIAAGFIIPIVILLVLGFIFTLKKPEKKAIYAREGFIIVALSWVIMSLFGALPFFLSGCIPNYINAVFETVSGFTTTGATILTNIEILPDSLLFWRSFTHWIGGMGVLVFALAILPKSDAQSIHVMRAEVPGPKVGKLVSKTIVTARILYGIYIALTALEIILLWAGGMELFDSVVTSFSTAGTGGFSVLNASIGGYNSLYAEIVIMMFMFLFGINFNLYYLILVKQFKQACKSEELRCYFLIVAGSIALITINILSIYENIWQALRYSGFQVISVITTTGFGTADYVDWPFFSQIIIIFLMIFGACSGSTGGGIKISRIMILFKSAGREIKRVFNPREVISVNMDGKPVEEEVVRGVESFFVLHVAIVAISCIFVALDGFGFTVSETVSSVITCINNVGPGLGRIGLSGNFSDFSWLSKIVLSFDMLIGRLEIYPMLILFMPSSWKRI